MDKYDNDLLKKIEKVRSLLGQNQVKHRAADQVSKQTYTLLRDRLTLDAGGFTFIHSGTFSLRVVLSTLFFLFLTHQDMTTTTTPWPRTCVDESQT